ncbi:MAG: hypothetical protein ABH806_01210 [Candidatus Omnitrophota bacterium]
MEESIKNRVIMILAILSMILFIGTIRSCGIAGKLKAVSVELDNEKAASWDSQQKMIELKNEKAAKEKEFEDVKADNETVKKALLQEQLVTKSLKEELEKITELKNKLEENLKEALVKNKSKTAK